MEFSLTLESGKAYAFISDFCYGSWGAVNCIGGNGDVDVNSKICIDSNKVHIEKLQKISCYITEISNLKSVFLGNQTPKNCIQYAIRKKLTNHSLSDIKELFSLTNERFNRPLKYVSGEIFPISLAINYALGKKIFCFPWLGELEINRIESLLPIINFLKSEDRIILIPSSQYERLEKICDRFVVFEDAKVLIK
jgi:ABC-type sugar transport system ATPase subunit